MVYKIKTTRTWWEKFQMTKTNGKILCVHGSEELIFSNAHTTQSHL